MVTPATKACHNCRRRRLKCDRTVPSCNKCRQLGQECLGYGKLFLWTQGVASRGKMMGKNYPTPAPRHDSSITLHSQNRSLPVNTIDRTEAIMSLPPTLLDPLLDVANHLAGDMVISDISDSNPFLNLIPFAKDHPILLYALVANAALHVSCLHRRGLPSSPGSSHISTTTVASSNAMIEALSAKHKALVLLRHSLNDLSTIDVNLVVTIVHLFIIFELIGQGEGEWRAHVQGAIRLISYLQALELCDASPLAVIRASITSDCLIYYVLGSTLMKTSTLSDPFLFAGDIMEVLTRAEANSYLSLPTPLLRILFKACELSNLVSTTKGQEESTALIENAYILLQAARSFNVNAWAEGLERSSSTRALSRIHTALAHQSAVRIYICRSVDQIAPLGEDTEALVDNIVTHLSAVGVDDPIYKATSWPTFIAGAETDNPVLRRWAMDRLQVFYNLIPWGYVKTAGEVMQTTWRLRDAGGDCSRSASWIQEIKALERYWLIA
ncbi:fungal-specific transcription factor domain-containing protein [Aspergillus karnatakaensis]|uniref:Zn(II)2Cys6 transcription factor n=1 Tax=Aspergillus karnatakaensis TaxID=1810916 RepID=UPI003CCD89E5